MLFNSIEFIIFLPIVFLVYWFITNRNLKLQNTLLLVASYLFYGWWDWRFLSLIAFSSLVDYLIGVQLGKSDKQQNRKILLWCSILVNLGFLGFFKYYNFFVESFADAFTLFGKSLDVERLKIILPVGISFYTFQTLSYSIDVYRRKLEPSKDIIAFFAFVSFFPQLVAGPIERASNLLPQFYKKRTFQYEQAADGMRQILWGLLKKVVIADNCALYVDNIFGSYEHQLGTTLLIAGILFAFQIYGDFSGYSDIAIGTAKLFGFKLMTNFNLPYLSRDIAEFWRRWHISLSTWFRDYLYIPLGGSRGNKWQIIRNTFIIFIVSGFWHGANWTFLLWGGLNAVYFLPLLLFKQNRKNMDVVAATSIFPTIKELLQIISTFFLTVFAWIIFRSQSIHEAYSYFKHMLWDNLLKHPGQIRFFFKEIWTIQVVYFILFMIILEWMQRKKEHTFEIGHLQSLPKHSLYLIVFFLIFLFGATQKAEFIYFQF